MEATVGFVVRIVVGEMPTLSGTVERVRTGEKHRFQDLESLGRLIVEMAQPSACDPQGPDARPGDRG